MTIFDSAQEFIDSATSLQDKIKKIDQVIDALMTTALKAASNDNVTEYSVDDGQTKIMTNYRGAAAVMNSIKMFEQLRQMYVNKLNGRVMRLVDGKNFTRYNYGRT